VPHSEKRNWGRSPELERESRPCGLTRPRRRSVYRGREYLIERGIQQPLRGLWIAHLQVGAREVRKQNGGNSILRGTDVYHARLHFIVSLYKLGVVNIVFSREANTKKRVDFIQLMHLKCGLRLSNGKSCMQAPIHVINMFCDGVLETAKGDRGLCLTQLLEVILDLVHIVASGSKQNLCQIRLQREEKSTLTKRSLDFDYTAAHGGLIFIVCSIGHALLSADFPNPRHDRDRSDIQLKIMSKQNDQKAELLSKTADYYRRSIANYAEFA